MTVSGEADVKFARDAWVRALARTAGIEDDARLTFPVLIDRLAQEFGAAPALLSLDDAMTYRQLAERASRYSRWGLARGLKAGDAVALLMPNCAEYVAVWLGLSRIGATVALLNTQLTGESLAHCIEIASPRMIIAAAELVPQLRPLRARLPELEHWVVGPGVEEFEALTPALAVLSGELLTEADYEPPTLDATALFIYTSGTTGLPKAAKVTHYRVMRWSQWFAGLLDTRREDRLYDCLPLYHSVGGVVAIGAALAGGAAVVIRRRFSATDFWRDVRDERCTMFQYIGELCRYLVNMPPQSNETQHALRVACGNGLRPEVWDTFKARFGVPRIVEYYASTEGNFSLYNCEGKPGSIGRIPPFLAHRLPVALIRLHPDSDEPLRNAAGLCERCTVDEVGEAVGLIPEGEAARAGRFEGYADAEASERKVLRGVFKAADAWYRTGDLMRRDGAGFYYFVDRVGETFRWKGENVSTAEVMSAIARAAGVREGVVYGVKVPMTDGRAGMAALVVDSTFDLVSFRGHVLESLPPYARPLFLRVLRDLPATSTFKPRKQDLQRTGFDPAQTSDPLYFDDSRAGAFLPLDAALFAAITAGSRKL